MRKSGAKALLARSLGPLDKARAFGMTGSKLNLALNRGRIRLVHFCPPFGKVVPMRVHRLDQPDLLAAAPAFDLLLAINRDIGKSKELVED
jgi:hypothetical protein